MRAIQRISGSGDTTSTRGDPMTEHRIGTREAWLTAREELLAREQESIAPLERLQAYQERMGWGFPWVSSLGSDFKFDFGAAFTEDQQKNGADYNFTHVDEPVPQREGLSAFAIQDGVVHHTYSTYAR